MQQAYGRMADHGTRAGYRAHLADGSSPCNECREASATYERERRQHRTAQGWKRPPRKRKPVSLVLLQQVWDDRILKQLLITASGCWEFTGSRTRRSDDVPYEDRYGHLLVAGRMVLTHRIAAALHLDLEIEDVAVKVCHRCDNPPCCNPAHLFLGDDGDNVRDAITKGRRPQQAGRPPQEVCEKGHDLSVTRRPKSKQEGAGTECGICRRERHTEYMREYRKRIAQAKAAAQVDG